MPMTPEELEHRWRMIERHPLVCPACGGKTWERWGHFVGIGLDLEAESDQPEISGMSGLARSCSACGYVVLFRRHL